MKLTIKKLGSPKTIITQYGPKQKNWLQASEHGEKFLNYWVSPTTSSWREGMEVEVLEVTENQYVGKDGTNKTSYDIKMPKVEKSQGNAEVMEALRQIRFLLDKHTDLIEELVMDLRSKDTGHGGGGTDKFPDDVGEDPEPNPNDIPF